MSTAEAAQVAAAEISEPLTWAEICARYPDEWVCLVEVDRVDPREFEFRTARVIGHGKTQRDSMDQASPWLPHYEEICHHYTSTLHIRYLSPRIIIDDETRDAFRYWR
jgi:hypothetical protein